MTNHRIRDGEAGETALGLVGVRVIDLETAGNGPTDVCEIGWQDVVHDPHQGWQVSADSRGALFVNPGRPISADTMAVHHILDAWVADAGFWKDVAPAVLRPQPVVLALAAHRAAFEQRFCTPGLSGGAEWVCTWKCALRLWPDLPRFSNQMLRYQRRPEGLDHALGLPAHRALPTPMLRPIICATCSMRCRWKPCWLGVVSPAFCPAFLPDRIAARRGRPSPMTPSTF